jgi:N-acetylmuramoyl-L-alanine amidase
MPIRHIVTQGEDVGSIAAEQGYALDTIWNDPGNRKLRDLRGSPFVLKPGDVIVIPDLRPRTESVATGATQRFIRHGLASLLQVVLRDTVGKPREKVAWELSVDGAQPITGTTGADGLVKTRIAPNAKKAVLTLRGARAPERHELDFCFLDPVQEIAGVQARLANLGYYQGPIDGASNAELEAALLTYQREWGLEPTGKSNAATERKLVELHGS